MALNNGEKARIAKRRRIIAEYRLKGIDDTWELMDLLEKEHSISVSERTIYYDKEAIEKQWNEASIQDNERRKVNLAQKYEHIYREAHSAWERSLLDAETTIQEMIEGEGGNGSNRLKASTRKEGQSGNPALLAQAQAALKAIREMFGVDVKNDPGSSEDKPFYMAQIKEIVVKRSPEGDTEAYESVEDSE